MITKMYPNISIIVYNILLNRFVYKSLNIRVYMQKHTHTLQNRLNMKYGLAMYQVGVQMCSTSVQNIATFRLGQSKYFHLLPIISLKLVNIK